MVRNYKRKTQDRWTKEDLLEALKNIQASKMKLNDAARQYNISRATLYRHFKKYLEAGGKCNVDQLRTIGGGGGTILTKVEEAVLESTITDLGKQGFTITASDIKRICFEYCESNGLNHHFNIFNQKKRMASHDWYHGFLKRHPGVRDIVDESVKRAENMKKKKALALASINEPSSSATTKAKQQSNEGSCKTTKTNKSSLLIPKKNSRKKRKSASTSVDPLAAKEELKTLKNKLIKEDEEMETEEVSRAEDMKEDEEMEPEVIVQAEDIKEEEISQVEDLTEEEVEMEPVEISQVEIVEDLEEQEEEEVNQAEDIPHIDSNSNYEADDDEDIDEQKEIVSDEISQTEASLNAEEDEDEDEDDEDGQQEESTGVSTEEQSAGDHDEDEDQDEESEENNQNDAEEQY